MSFPGHFDGTGSGYPEPLKWKPACGFGTGPGSRPTLLKIGSARATLAIRGHGLKFPEGTRKPIAQHQPVLEARPNSSTFSCFRVEDLYPRLRLFTLRALSAMCIFMVPVEALFPSWISLQINNPLRRKIGFRKRRYTGAAATPACALGGNRSPRQGKKSHFRYAVMNLLNRFISSDCCLQE